LVEAAEKISVRVEGGAEEWLVESGGGVLAEDYDFAGGVGGNLEPGEESLTTDFTDCFD
jgi:hypothetical protein